MRHAVWRAGPNDARNFPTYAGRAARRWGWLILLVPLALFGVSALVCWPLALLGFYLTCRRIAPKLAALKPDELSPVLPDPPPARLFRHSVAYLHRYLVVGQDDIAFSFVDGWLIGQGVRSEFALRHQDVAAIDAPVHGAAFLYLKNGQRVPLHDLHVYARESLLEWHEARIPVAGEPTFPPNTAQPRQILKTQVRAMTAVALMVLAVPATLCAGGVAGSLGSALGICAVLFGMIRLGLAMADLLAYRSISRSQGRRTIADRTETHDPALR